MQIKYGAAKSGRVTWREPSCCCPMLLQLTKSGWVTWHLQEEQGREPRCCCPKLLQLAQHTAGLLKGCLWREKSKEDEWGWGKVLGDAGADGALFRLLWSYHHPPLDAVINKLHHRHFGGSGKSLHLGQTHQKDANWPKCPHWGPLPLLPPLTLLNI